MDFNFEWKIQNTKVFYDPFEYIKDYSLQIIRQKLIKVHQDKLPSHHILKKLEKSLDFVNNYTISLRQTSRLSIGWPYGQCIDYKSSQRQNSRPFDSTSHTQCYRKCLKRLYKSRFDCIPLFVDHIIHESDSQDFGHNQTLLCPSNPNDLLRQRDIDTKYCENICPEDCLKVDFEPKYRISGIQATNDRIEMVERRIVWDTSCQSFFYIDEPVLTMSSYLVYCGGLMGLWFGQSLKDLFVMITESRFVLVLKNKITSRF